MDNEKSMKPHGQLMERDGTPWTRKHPPDWYCPATAKQTGRQCGRRAGHGTGNKGVGPCRNHGGATPIKTGRYSKINRPRIKELIEQFEADPNPTDLLPEIQLLRALIQDYVERYDEYTEALILWWDAEINPHLYHNELVEKLKAEMKRNRILIKGFDKLVKELHSLGLKEPIDKLEAFWREHEEVEPIQRDLDRPTRYSRPRKIIDILQVGNFIGQIGTLVEKIHKLKQKSTISLEALDRVVELLGVEVVNAAKEVIDDPAKRAKLLEKIEHRWSTIRVEPDKPSR